MNRLLEALQRGGIHYDVPGRHKPAFLREVLARMTLPAGGDRERLLEGWLERERAVTCTLSGGVVFPHFWARSGPDLVALAFPRAPVVWGTRDGAPAEVALCVLAGSDPPLGLYAPFFRLLGGSVLFREALRDRAEPEWILEVMREGEVDPELRWRPPAPSERRIASIALVTVGPGSPVHARPAARIVEAVAGADVTVRLLADLMRVGDKEVCVPLDEPRVANAGRMIELLMVVGGRGCIFELICPGSATLGRLKELFTGPDLGVDCRSFETVGY